MEDTFHLGIKGIIRNQEGKILLLKVNTSKLKKYSGPSYWDIPGGRIRKGDSVAETLKREIKEEIGIVSIKNIRPFSMVLSKIRIPTGKKTVGLILGAYFCEVPSKSEIKLSDEHIEARWFSSERAAEMLSIKYPREFTEKIKDL